MKRLVPPRAARLRELRRRWLDLSARELAARVPGLTQDTVYNLERGSQHVTDELVAELVRIFGIDEDALERPTGAPFQAEQAPQARVVGGAVVARARSDPARGVRLHQGSLVELGEETSRAMDAASWREFMDGLHRLGFRFDAPPPPAEGDRDETHADATDGPETARRRTKEKPPSRGAAGEGAAVKRVAEGSG